MEIMRIGLDLAKNAFEAFGVDAQETEELRKNLKRNAQEPQTKKSP